MLLQLGTRLVRTVAQLVEPVLGATRPRALPAPPALAARREELLDRSLAQSTDASRRELHERILELLTSDEARILELLAHGGVHPLVHVHSRRPGSSSEPLLRNATLLGKLANVSLPEHATTYVAHLLSLGLVTIGPEQPSLRDDYQILFADRAVRRAVHDGSLGVVPARIERFSVTLSPLGAELWGAAGGGR